MHKKHKARPSPAHAHTRPCAIPLRANRLNSIIAEAPPRRPHRVSCRSLARCYYSISCSQPCAMQSLQSSQHRRMAVRCACTVHGVGPRPSGCVAMRARGTRAPRIERERQSAWPRCGNRFPTCFSPAGASLRRAASQHTRSPAYKKDYPRLHRLRWVVGSIALRSPCIAAASRTVPSRPGHPLSWRHRASLGVGRAR